MKPGDSIFAIMCRIYPSINGYRQSVARMVLSSRCAAAVAAAIAVARAGTGAGAGAEAGAGIGEPEPEQQ